MVFVEEGKVQQGWPFVVEWVGGGCVGSIRKAKVCCIADVE